MGPFVCRSIGHNYLKGRKVYFQDPIGALVCIRITEENHHGNFDRRDYIKVHGNKNRIDNNPFFTYMGIICILKKKTPSWSYSCWENVKLSCQNAKSCSTAAMPM